MMDAKQFLQDVRQSQRALVAGGAISVAAFLILAVVSLVDAQQILGVNRWLKPMKFFASIAIYLWTIAVFLHFLPGYERSKKVIGWGAMAAMAGEMVLIVMQAARGTTSHFNNATAFDGMVYSAMGLLILINSALVIYLTILYFRAAPDLPNALVWGMRLGLLIFLAASAEGGYMSAQTGHAVGVRDGGAGLPLVNWSTEGGDLRAAHFVGMHALQAIPLFGLLLVRIEKRFAPLRPTALTVIFSLIYFAMFSLVFVQALRGRPLLGKEIIVTQKPAADAESKRSDER